MSGATVAELPNSPPKDLEEVDAWLEKYNAAIEASRKEALRVEQLRDAAPDLVMALQGLIRAGHALSPSSKEWNAAHEALTKAGA